MYILSNFYQETKLKPKLIEKIRYFRKVKYYLLAYLTSKSDMYNSVIFFFQENDIDDACFKDELDEEMIKETISSTGLRKKLLTKFVAEKENLRSASQIHSESQENSNNST